MCQTPGMISADWKWAGLKSCFKNKERIWQKTLYRLTFIRFPNMGLAVVRLLKLIFTPQIQSHQHYSHIRPFSDPCSSKWSSKADLGCLKILHFFKKNEETTQIMQGKCSDWITRPWKRCVAGVQPDSWTQLANRLILISPINWGNFVQERKIAVRRPSLKASRAACRSGMKCRSRAIPGPALFFRQFWFFRQIGKFQLLKSLRYSIDIGKIAKVLLF